METDPHTGYKNKDYGQSKELFYYYQDGGVYDKKVGFHPDTDRVILQQAWDLFHERIEAARKRVLAGEISPIAYYMEKNLLDPLNLSMVAGISIWRVKRHFKPGRFLKLKEKTLKKYATAFNISIEQLKKVEQ
jgi:hypothetical protein